MLAVDISAISDDPFYVARMSKGFLLDMPDVSGEPEVVGEKDAKELHLCFSLCLHLFWS